MTARDGEEAEAGHPEDEELGRDFSVATKIIVRGNISSTIHLFSGFTVAIILPTLSTGIAALLYLFPRTGSAVTHESRPRRLLRRPTATL